MPLTMGFWTDFQMAHGGCLLGNGLKSLTHLC